MNPTQSRWNAVERLLDACRDTPEEALLTAAAAADKLQTKSDYEWLNRTLNELTFERPAYFLNFGYVPNDNPTSSVISPPSGHLDVNARRLVLEVIGDCPVNGRDVVDVSCGRGSVAAVLRDYFH